MAGVQNLLLAAHALGLGSALTTITTVFGDELRSLLTLPDHVRPLGVVPLGWPAKQLGPPRRAPVAEKTFRERYGTRWSRVPLVGVDDVQHLLAGGVAAEVVEEDLEGARHARGVTPTTRAR